MTFADYARTCKDKTRTELGLTKTVEWCAEFISSVIKTCRPDLENVCSFSCNDMKRLMLDSGLFYEPEDAPQINDIGFIDWNRGANGDTERPLDHVVIISKGYGDLYVDYIDGNSSDGGGNSPDGKVKEHFRYKMNVTSDFPDYYLRLVPNANRESFYTNMYNADIYKTIHRLQEAHDNISEIINDLIKKFGDH
jgi:hypothetical protein